MLNNTNICSKMMTRLQYKLGDVVMEKPKVELIELLILCGLSDEEIEIFTSVYFSLVNTEPLL